MTGIVLVVNNTTEFAALTPTAPCIVMTNGYTTAGDGGHARYWFNPSDTTSVADNVTTFVSTNNARWHILPENGFINALQGGAKSDNGTTDNGPILSRILGIAYNKGLGLHIPRPNNGGFYGLSTTFNNAQCSAAAALNQSFALTCDPAASLAAVAQNNGALIDFTYIYLAGAKIELGIINANNLADYGVALFNIQDSEIKINRIAGAVGNNLQIVTPSPNTNNETFFNNNITINNLSLARENGLNIIGDAVTSPYGPQGNRFQFGQIASNGYSGIVIGANGTPDNAQYNLFIGGVIEANQNGFSDYSGNNVLLAPNTNSNTANGLCFWPQAHKDLAMGIFTDPIYNSNTSNIIIP